MLIGGLVAIAGGLVSSIYAASVRDTVKYSLGSLFGTEKAAQIDFLLIFGFALILAGAVLMCIHFVRKGHDLLGAGLVASALGLITTIFVASCQSVVPSTAHETSLMDMLLSLGITLLVTGGVLLFAHAVGKRNSE